FFCVSGRGRHTRFSRDWSSDVCSSDLDGVREVLAAGNFFPYKPQLGRCDASTGVVLRHDGKGGFTCDVKSEVWLTGDIRGIGMARSSNGTRKVIVSRNNDRAGVFE